MEPPNRGRPVGTWAAQVVAAEFYLDVVSEHDGSYSVLSDQ